MGFFSGIGSAIGGDSSAAKKPADTKPDDFDEIERFIKELENDVKKEMREAPSEENDGLADALKKNLSPKEIAELMRKKK